MSRAHWTLQLAPSAVLAVKPDVTEQAETRKHKDATKNTLRIANPKAPKMKIATIASALHP
jgi:hypothetical protein